MRPVGRGETLRQALAKLVMSAAGDQTKTAYGNLQLCAGLEAGIEGATHAVGQRRLQRVKRRQKEEEEAEGSEEEEERGGIMACLNNSNIETAGIEEEAEEGLKSTLWRDVG